MTTYLSNRALFQDDGSETNQRLMVFVDGENLSIRFKELAKDNNNLPSETRYKEDLYVWSNILHQVCIKNFNVIRKFYYTSLKGDEQRIDQIYRELKAMNIEAPRVFKRTKDNRSKQVDISLATDMLVNAARKNYDVALLVAGDEDYVPLIQAVQSEGCKVNCWFINNGVSDKLIKTCDFYYDITNILISTDIKIG